MAIINKTGITNGGTIQAEHVTRIIDALSGGSTDTIVATGSFTGSYKGDGSQLTGIVSSKWTGSNPISRVSDVNITGDLNVNGNLGANIIVGERIEAKDSLYSTKPALYILGGDQVTYIYGPQRLLLFATESIRLSAETIVITEDVTAFRLDLLNSGSDNGAGFVLPKIEPKAPTTGSMYISSDVRTFYIHDGSVWKSGSLN
jgi:hypothetical protein